MRLPRVILIIASICSIVPQPAQAQNRGRRNSFGSSVFGGILSDGLRGGASFIGGLFTGHQRGGGSSGSPRRGSSNEFRGGFPQSGYQEPGPGFSPRLFPAGEPVYRPRFQGGYGTPVMYPARYQAAYGSPAYDFNYAQPYAPATQYPSAPRFEPEYDYASRPSYAPVYNQPRYSPPSWSESYASVPDYYMIAFNDGTIQAALTYSVDGNILHWTTRNHLERRAPIAAVDRYFSEELNRDRRVDFRLP